MRRAVLAVVTLALVFVLPFVTSAATPPGPRTTGSTNKVLPVAAIWQTSSFQAYAVYLLPDVTLLPYGFTQQDNYLRSLSQEAAQFADPIAMQRLAGWGWQANAYRSFSRSSTGTTFLDVSINLFTTGAAAIAANQYFVAHDQVANPTWLVEPNVPIALTVGGLPKLFSSVWLTGVDANGGGIGADLFVQVGAATFRVGGVALTTTPRSEMIAVAIAIIQKILAAPV